MKTPQRDGLWAAVKMEEKEAEEAMAVDVVDTADAPPPPSLDADEAALLAAALGGDAAVAVDATTLERGVEEEVKRENERLETEGERATTFSSSLTLRFQLLPPPPTGRAPPRRGDEEGSAEVEQEEEAKR